MIQAHKRVKYACYTTNLSMAVVANLSPLLFLTFRSLYDISYSLLGTLVLVNFVTQLLIDLIFSFYSHKFNIAKTVKFTPVLTAAGLLIFALAPVLFPQAVYIGLVLGTVVFACSGGLAEVLISPVIAAIPSENPEREMSKLHSMYAWGVVGVVIISTLFLLVFGKEHWQWLALLWMALPILSAALFSGAKIPAMESPGKASSAVKMLFNKDVMLSFFCIFLGGASENTMSQWSSSYLEQALHIPKVWGDIFGVALFGVMLGLGRSLYAKFGRNLHLFLFFGSLFACVAYLVMAASTAPLLGLIACAATGFFVSMLWPGSLVVGSGRFPAAGVALFALMAAGGDLGGSVGPQLIGVLTDAVMKNEAIVSFAGRMGLTAEQAGMKCGMLAAAVFPLLAAVLFAISWKKERKQRAEAPVEEVVE